MYNYYSNILTILLAHRLAVSTVFFLRKFKNSLTENPTCTFQRARGGTACETQCQ